jgi:hypothetical protein
MGHTSAVTPLDETRLRGEAQAGTAHNGLITHALNWRTLLRIPFLAVTPQTDWERSHRTLALTSSTGVLGESRRYAY